MTILGFFEGLCHTCAFYNYAENVVPQDVIIEIRRTKKNNSILKSLELYGRDLSDEYIYLFNLSI